MTKSNETNDMRAIGCSDIKAALSAYVDDELTREERLRADAHLVGCGACRDLIERAEKLDDTLREHVDLEHEHAAEEGDQGAPERNAGDERLGAINGIEHPGEVRAFVLRPELFPEDPVAGEHLGDPRAHQLFCPAVGGGHRRSVGLGLYR